MPRHTRRLQELTNAAQVRAGRPNQSDPSATNQVVDNPNTERDEARVASVFQPGEEAGPDDPRHAGFVQGGDTGGFLDPGDGQGFITIGEGRSTRPEDARRLREEAIQGGLSESAVDAWLAQNPGDYERIQSALFSDRSGGSEENRTFGSSGGNAQQTGGPDPNSTQARINDLYNRLLERASQGTDIDRNDPAIRQQADAFSANQQRASRDFLGDVAERGGPLGNLRGEQRMAAEQVGQSTGAFEASLIGQELTNRRNEIAGALQSMQGLLTENQRVELERELANIDAAIRNRGLDIQESLGSRGLDLQARGQDLGFDQFLRNLALQQWQAENTDFYRRSGLY